MCRGVLAVGACAALVLAGCTPEAKDGNAGPSTAADAVLARASSDDERRALENARDEIDARAREEIAARDAEIDRLKRENDELRRRLGER